MLSAWIVSAWMSYKHLPQSQLATVSQTRLHQLLALNAESQLSTDEVAELDRLIAQVDQLTILKTRARYTLQRLHELATLA